tara:strand:+ start:32 stop:421 length:390 start_codon:yes stop_codon:yes gene_type:complete
MKKLLAILVLGLLWCNVVFASWIKVNSGSGADIYMDLERSTTEGNYVYYWDLVNYKKVQDNGHLSSARYIKGDCATKTRYKTLQYLFYKGNMGAGEMEKQDSVVKDWKYNPPGSIGEFILEKVCKLHNK